MGENCNVVVVGGEDNKCKVPLNKHVAIVL